MLDWVKHFPAAITVVDRDGIVIQMNDKSCETFASYGGAKLIGTSIYDVHPPYACDKIRQMLLSGEANTYTIEKGGTKKLIHQQPWFDDGIIAGVVEMSIVIPSSMPNYVRD